MSDHTPPQDIPAERAVIGSVLMSSAALDDVAEIINPGDFYQPRHEAIFRAALAVQAKRQEGVDTLTVNAELARTGDADRCGGLAYLNECVDAIPGTAASAVHHAEIVVEQAKRRLIDAAARRIMAAVQSGTSDADAILAEAEEEIGNISATRNRIRVRPLSETLDHTLTILDEPPVFTPTAWPDLNEHIYGWRPGALHIIGARPGGGKSMMGLQSAIGMAKTGKAVTYAVMEMDTDELNIRLLAQSATIGMDSLAKRRLTAHEWERISARVPELSGLPLYVDDTPRQTMAHVRAHARHVARRADLGMIVVDYVQQVVVPDHLQGRPRHEQIAHTSALLKALAREMNVPVLAMAQVRRPGEGHTDKPPTMSDLRESGSIEADADDVILLHRPHSDDPEVGCYVRKARVGRDGDFKLVWEGHFARMRSHANPYGSRTA